MVKRVRGGNGDLVDDDAVSGVGGELVGAGDVVLPTGSAEAFRTVVTFAGDVLALDGRSAKFGCGGRRRTPHGRRTFGADVSLTTVACICGFGGGAAPFASLSLLVRRRCRCYCCCCWATFVRGRVSVASR